MQNALYYIIIVVIIHSVPKISEKYSKLNNEQYSAASWQQVVRMCDELVFIKVRWWIGDESSSTI